MHRTFLVLTVKRWLVKIGIHLQKLSQN